MGKYSEETFRGWHKAASETEESRISNTLSMVRDGVSNHPELSKRDIEIFVQGSYGNNTNVRKESDIDVCVMLRSTFFSKYPQGVSRANYGFTEGTNSYSDFRKWVIKAMNDKFGSDYVDTGNKSVKIQSNSYHVHADVVPAFQYRNYTGDRRIDSENFVEGIKFFSSTKETIVNYPKLHIENGKAKNAETKRRYKRLIRIFKRIKIQMENEGKSVNSTITSFLLSGLIYNLPNSIFNDLDTWEDRIKKAIIYLWNHTKESSDCGDWTEVSEMLLLFNPDRKWTHQDVNFFLKEMWNFLEFK